MDETRSFEDDALQTPTDWHEKMRLLALEDQMHRDFTTTPNRSKRNTRKWLLPLVVLMTCIWAGFVLGYYVAVGEVVNPRHLVRPASLLPFLQGIDTSVSMRTVTVQLGTSTPGENASESIWQRTPSPEVDWEWEMLQPNYLMLFTAEDLRQLGKNPSDYVSVPEEYGYGENRFFVRFLHIHNIHCLDMLRQRAYAHHYPHLNNLTASWVHLDHCVQSLIEHFLCHVEYDVFPYVWVEGEAKPQVDIRFTRQCRNYEALQKFSEDHRVDTDLRVQYLQPPPGATIYEQDPYWRNFEDAFDLANPQKKAREARRLERKLLHEQAMAQWRASGKIPTGDMPPPWEPQTVG